MDWTVFVNMFTAVAGILFWFFLSCHLVLDKKEESVSWVSLTAITFWVIALPAAVLTGFVSF